MHSAHKTPAEIIGELVREKAAEAQRGILFYEKQNGKHNGGKNETTKRKM
jgi:hypothetical protein